MLGRKKEVTTVSSNSSRRNFLRDAGFVASAAWLSSNVGLLTATAAEAADLEAAGAPWQNITDHEARVLAALADQIYPPDEQSAGASELGAVMVPPSIAQIFPPLCGQIERRLCSI